MRDSSKEYKPKIFIGSSQESVNKGLTRALQASFRDNAHPFPYDVGLIKLSNYTIEALEVEITKCDAAVFLFEPDDVVISRGVEKKAVRDNLLFELGLAMGILGRNKTFFIIPKNFDMKTASDFSGMCAGEYDATHSNKQAALDPCVDQIIQRLQNDNTIHYNKKPTIRLNYDRHQRQVDPSLKMEEKITQVFSEGIIRENWNIDLHYDCDRVKDNIVTETIIWDYNLVNVTTQNINRTIKLDLYTDPDRNTIHMYKITNSKGDVVSLLDGHRITIQGAYKRIETDFTFLAGETYRVDMQFEQKFNVCKKTCSIVNCFAPRETTIGAKIKATIPPGYKFDVLEIKPVTPDNMKNVFVFNINGVLLPEQVIEYTFRKILPNQKNHHQ